MTGSVLEQICDVTSRHVVEQHTLLAVERSCKLEGAKGCRSSRFTAPKVPTIAMADSVAEMPEELEFGTSIEVAPFL